MSTMEGIKPIEEVDPEFAEWVRKITHREIPYSISGTEVYLKRDGKYYQVDIPKEDEPGRNDPCPYCLKEGKSIKWKKCSIHNQ